MIVANLKGGLGNQMFQYAFFYNYARKNKIDHYFQDPKFFKEHEDEVLEIFRQGIPSETDMVAIHVRRGDYLNVSSRVHPTLLIKYYEDALSHLSNDMKVLIFSDDLKWCKENFIDDRYVFIDEIDYISIYLMSKMKYHIIANSSFSWWGAWMSEYEDKIIITPKMWFGKNTMYDGDLIPENWIRI